MPDPLVAAAEATAAVIAKRWRDVPAEVLEAGSALNDALRAALAAHRQRDERAEAAVALCEAQDRNTAAFDAWYRLIDDDPEKTDWPKVKPAKAELEAARVVLAAARRRWAEVEGRRA